MGREREEREGGRRAHLVLGEVQDEEVEHRLQQEDQEAEEEWSGHEAAARLPAAALEDPALAHQGVGLHPKARLNKIGRLQQL